MRKLLLTKDDFAMTIIRVALGVVMFAHGAQKVLGWFGGHGFSGTMHMFTTMMHIPAPFAFLAICAEFFGGLGLIVGLLSRVAAFGIFVEMGVTVALIHHKFGFFMNWAGNKNGEGFEYHMLAMAIALAVVIEGAGRFSIDHALTTPKSTGLRRGRAS